MSCCKTSSQHFWRPEGEIRDKMCWKSSRNLLPVALKVEVRTCLLGGLFLDVEGSESMTTGWWPLRVHVVVDTGACPKPALPRLLAPRKLAVKWVDFKRRMSGAGQFGVEQGCVLVGGGEGSSSGGRAGLTALELLFRSKSTTCLQLWPKSETQTGCLFWTRNQQPWGVLETQQWDPSNLKGHLGSGVNIRRTVHTRPSRLLVIWGGERGQERAWIPCLSKNMGENKRNKFF